MIDQYSSLSEKFFKKGFWLYFFSFVIAPIGYIVKIIISGELSVSEIGILYGVLSFVILLSGFNDFGMSESLNHFIPKYVVKKSYDKVKSILVYAFLTQLTTGIIIALILFLGADFLGEYYFKSEASKNIIKIFALYFLGINIFQVFNTFFIAIQNTFYNKFTEFLRMVFILVFTLTIFFLDLGNLVNYSFVWIIGLYFGVVFVIYFFYTRYYKTYLKNEKSIFSRKLLKKIFSYAIIVFVGSQASVILSQIDMQMIIYILGTTDAGYYTNYLSIIGIPFMLIGPIFTLFFPLFSELYSKEEYQKIRFIKQIFQKNFVAISIAFNILFFIFAEIIAFILFGEKFIKSGTILQYSILFVVFNFLLQINFNILAGIGKVKERLKIVSMAIIFNGVLNFILINLMGVVGAALATGFGWIFIWISSEFVLGKKYSSSFNYKFLCKNIFFIGVLGYFYYIFLKPFFIGIGRRESLFLLGILSGIRFLVFIIINLKEFKIFVGEIKKLNKGANLREE